MTTRRDVFNKLNQTKKLPTPSKTTLEVIRLCHNEATSLNDIARVIETDPALSAELLKYANAAFLATGIQVASVQKATVKLGMQTVVNLSLGFSLLSGNKQGKCENFDYGKFWSTALCMAIAAKTIASRGKEFDPEELFVCGLLANMGELALASLFPRQYAEILADNPDDETCKILEKKEFEISSSELTVELFLDWGLPAHYALAAGFYGDLDYAELGVGATQRIAELLHLTRRIAAICHDVQATGEQLLAIEASADKYTIDAGDFAAVFDEIITRWHEYGEMFEIRTQQCLMYKDIRQPGE